VADEEITARFDDLTWTAAPGALSAASFERAEVYRVIEARGPVFPKSIADELGMERTSVQHLVAGLVQAGAVARVRGGYVAAEVVIETAEPLSLPLHSTHSKSEERDRETTGRESEWSGGGHPPAGAREVGRARQVGSRVLTLPRVSATSRAGAAGHLRRSGRRPCLLRRAEGMSSR
jgi:hypothetical protein